MSAQLHFQDLVLLNKIISNEKLKEFQEKSIFENSELIDKRI